MTHLSKRIATSGWHRLSNCGGLPRRCPARTNPKSETRNPKQAPNPNDKFSKPEQSVHSRRPGFEHFCSFAHSNLFRISDFGFSAFARRSSQIGGVQRVKS